MILLTDGRLGPLETVPSGELRSAVEWPLLRAQIERLRSVSPFYRERLRDCRDLQTVDDLAAVPFTTKAEILAEQAAYPPFGRLSEDISRSSLRRVHVTSGSTGTPQYVVLTERDVEDTVRAGRQAFICAGLTAADSVVHCLNYCMWAGGVSDHMSLEATGAMVIPFGVGNTSLLIDVLRLIRPTAISSTPSYMARLEVVLKELGLRPPELGLEKGLFGGEGGLQNPAVRSSIEHTWGIRAVDANYGMSDILSIFASECEHRAGLHFHGQGVLYVELIDPMTGAVVPIQDGAVGELVLTNLTREAQPVVRCRTGDMIQVIGTGRCRCGRLSMRFRVEGRADDMIVVSGINVYPNAVKNILAEKPQWFSGEFELVVNSPPPIQHPVLRVEFTDPAPAGKIVSEWLLSQCKNRLSFRPRLVFLNYGDLPRTEGKRKRVRISY